MKYTMLIYKHENGLWCTQKEFSNGEKSAPYFFAVSPLAVKFKLIEDGEDEDNIIYDGGLNKKKVL